MTRLSFCRCVSLRVAVPRRLHFQSDISGVSPLQEQLQPHKYYEQSCSLSKHREERQHTAWWDTLPHTATWRPGARGPPRSWWRRSPQDGPGRCWGPCSSWPSVLEGSGWACGSGPNDSRPHRTTQNQNHRQKPVTQTLRSTQVNISTNINQSNGTYYCGKQENTTVYKGKSYCLNIWILQFIKANTTLNTEKYYSYNIQILKIMHRSTTN